MKPRTSKFIATLLVTPAVLLTTASFAQELERPNYNYVELDYVYATADVDSDQYNAQQNADTFFVPYGLELKGSGVVVEQLLLRGSYYYGQGEWKSTDDVDVSSLMLSAGWLAPTTDATGIDVSVEYRSDSVELSSRPDQDVDGYGLTFGVRATPFKNAEFGVRVGWYEGDFNGSIGYSLNLAYNIGDHFGINTYWERMDADVNETNALQNYELNKFGVGGRFYF